MVQIYFDTCIMGEKFLEVIGHSVIVTEQYLALEIAQLCCIPPYTTKGI